MNKRKMFVGGFTVIAAIILLYIVFFTNLIFNSSCVGVTVNNKMGSLSFDLIVRYFKSDRAAERFYKSKNFDAYYILAVDSDNDMGYRDTSEWFASIKYPLIEENTKYVETTSLDSFMKNNDLMIYSIGQGAKDNKIDENDFDKSLELFDIGAHYIFDISENCTNEERELFISHCMYSSSLIHDFQNYKLSVDSNDDYSEKYWLFQLKDLIDNYQFPNIPSTEREDINWNDYNEKYCKYVDQIRNLVQKLETNERYSHGDTVVLSVYAISVNIELHNKLTDLPLLTGYNENNPDIGTEKSETESQEISEINPEDKPNIEILSVTPLKNDIDNLKIEYRINNIKDVRGCVYLKTDSHAYFTQTFFNDDLHLNEYRSDGLYSYTVGWLNDSETKYLSIVYGCGEFDPYNGWNTECQTKMYYRLIENNGRITSKTIPQHGIHDIYDGDKYIGAWTLDPSGELIEETTYLFGDSEQSEIIIDSETNMSNNTDSQSYYYDEGCVYLKNKQYLKAIDCFEHNLDYLDSEDKYKEANYLYGEELLNNGNPTEAAGYFLNAGDYKDSSTRIQRYHYEKAETLLKNKDYLSASEEYLLAGAYSDSNTKILECYYQYGVQQLDQNNLSAAQTYLSKCKGYKDSDEKLLPYYYSDASKEVDKMLKTFSQYSFTQEVKDAYATAKEKLLLCGNYNDSKVLLKIVDKLYYAWDTTPSVTNHEASLSNMTVNYSGSVVQIYRDKFVSGTSCNLSLSYNAEDDTFEAEITNMFNDSARQSDARNVILGLIKIFTSIDDISDLDTVLSDKSNWTISDSSELFTVKYGGYSIKIKTASSRNHYIDCNISVSK